MSKTIVIVPLSHFIASNVGARVFKRLVSLHASDNFHTLSHEESCLPFVSMLTILWTLFGLTYDQSKL